MQVQPGKQAFDIDAADGQSLIFVSFKFSSCAYVIFDITDRAPARVQCMAISLENKLIAHMLHGVRYQWFDALMETLFL